MPAYCNVSWNSAYGGPRPGIFHNDQIEKNEAGFQLAPVQGSLFNREFCRTAVKLHAKAVNVYNIIT